jgi:hypothetical protein
VTALPRLDPRQGLVRGVRAAVLTVPTVGGAVAAHAMADGCGSPLAIALAVGLCWPAAVAMLGARRRVPALIAWVALAQLVTHVLLERMCQDVVTGQMTLVDHLARGTTPSMVAAHTAAVLVTAVLLGRADAGLWTADAMIRAGARALRMTSDVAAPTLPVVARPPTAPASSPRPRVLWETAPLQRRGPPALVTGQRCS